MQVCKYQFLIDFIFIKNPRIRQIKPLLVSVSHSDKVEECNLDKDRGETDINDKISRTLLPQIEFTNYTDP